MTSLVFPDVNVWLALSTPEHVHNGLAKRWWRLQDGPIAFSRITQLGFLRLITTAAAMGGKPLTLTEAWSAYDSFYGDDRVLFLSDPPSVDQRFRARASVPTASPKIWQDAWLLAVAETAQGTLVTFDRALKSLGAYCLLGER